MLEKFAEFLKDPNDNLSSKRLIGLAGAVNATGYIWTFTYLGKMDPVVGLYAFMSMVAGGILGATIDHFIKPSSS